jgi:hypothetical protein
MLLPLLLNLSAAVVAPPAQVVETPAGGRARRREQYIVRIDGQEFVCNSLQAVETLLFKARESAKLFSVKEAEKAAKRVAETARVELPTFAQPKIEISSRELRPLVAQAKRDIADTYRQALIETELRMLFEVRERQEQDEDALILLM